MRVCERGAVRPRLLISLLCAFGRKTENKMMKMLQKKTAEAKKPSTIRFVTQAAMKKEQIKQAADAAALAAKATKMWRKLRIVVAMLKVRGERDSSVVYSRACVCGCVLCARVCAWVCSSSRSSAQHATKKER